MIRRLVWRHREHAWRATFIEGLMVVAGILVALCRPATEPATDRRRAQARLGALQLMRASQRNCGATGAIRDAR